MSLMLHELRTAGQLPLFLSVDAIRVVQWAREIPERKEWGGDRKIPPMTFTDGELIGFLSDTEPPWPKDSPERQHAEAVRYELRAGGMLGDGGWFKYTLRADMADIVPEPCVDCVVPLYGSA